MLNFIGKFKGINVKYRVSSYGYFRDVVIVVIVNYL